MNGAPANPITGTGDSRRRSRIASSSGPTDASGSNGRIRATSAAVRIGRSMTGPTPSTSSTSTPAPGSGVVMSANTIAASTSRRCTGCRLTSAHRAASPTISTRRARSRILRYSGSERPAWRMNQTGVVSTGSPRSARRSRVARAGRSTSGPGHGGERAIGRLERGREFGRAVGEREEPGLERRGRKEDASVEHRPEERAECRPIRGQGVLGVGRCGRAGTTGSGANPPGSRRPADPPRRRPGPAHRPVAHPMPRAPGTRHRQGGRASRSPPPSRAGDRPGFRPGTPARRGRRAP